MEPAFATLVSNNLMFNRLDDVLVLAAAPNRRTALIVNQMQRGAVTSNSSQSGFPIELVKSPQVQRGLNTPQERVVP